MDATEHISPTLRAESGDPHMTGRAAVAYQCHGSDAGRMGTLRSGHGDVQSGVPFVFESKKSGDGGEISPTLRALNHDNSHANGGGQLAVQYGMAVRRLTPRECERLQGFRDDWTRYGINDKGEQVEISDSARYRMCGNAVTVSVVEWIAKRIAKFS